MIKTFKYLGIIILIAVVILIFRSGKEDDNAGLALLANRQKEVKIASVAELGGVKSTLPLIGEVKSESEIVLRSEISGEISKVYKKIGDEVRQGELIAEIKNEVQKAALTQADAQVDAANALFIKLQKGQRDEQIDILEFNRQKAFQSLQEAKISAINALRNAFILADDAIRGKIDQMFSNPRSPSVKINFIVPNAFRIEDKRILTEGLLLAWENANKTLTVDSDLILYFRNADETLGSIAEFLDLLASEINSLTSNVRLSKTSINEFTNLVSFARSNVNSAKGSISNARGNLNSQVSLLDIAEKHLEQAKAGERDEDIASAEAALKQARGALALARANLEKTLIRATIPGTLTLFSVDRGDFVSAFEEVAIVSNKGVSEIITFITEDDLNSISPGAIVKIQGKYNGIVTSVARALDKKTKKIEVKISINGEEVEFISGQTVALEIERKNDLSKFNQFLIPISALKISSEGTVVFTVNEADRVSENPIVEGSIVGDSVIVKSGLTAEMEIVLDARGLKDGDTVSIKK